MTEIVIEENGDETHESWIKLTTHKSSGTPRVLFDSEIKHSHTIGVRVYRCQRRRELKRDYSYTTELLIEWEMSDAQWGAFVSSFGEGGGVPATLRFLNGAGDGVVPEAPFESRLAESHREVRDAGTEAISKVAEAFGAVEDAFERKAGRRELGGVIRTLHFAIENAPANMEFAAASLTAHTENVVAKARADIEAMVADAGGARLLDGGSASISQLVQGEVDSIDAEEIRASAETAGEAMFERMDAERDAAAGREQP